MQDIDGNQVDIGDTVKVLVIRENIRRILSEEEREPTMEMLGNDFEIEDLVNDNTQISVSYQHGCLWGGLYLFPHEFRLIKKAKRNK